MNNFECAMPKDGFKVEKDRKVKVSEYGCYWIYRNNKTSPCAARELSFDSYFYANEIYVKVTSEHAPKCKASLKPGWYYVQMTVVKSWEIRYKKPDGKSYSGPDSRYCMRDGNGNSIIFDEYYLAYRPIVIGEQIDIGEFK